MEGKIAEKELPHNIKLGELPREKTKEEKLKEIVDAKNAELESLDAYLYQ